MIKMKRKLKINDCYSETVINFSTNKQMNNREKLEAKFKML